VSIAYFGGGGGGDREVRVFFFVKEGGNVPVKFDPHSNSLFDTCKREKEK